MAKQKQMRLDGESVTVKQDIFTWSNFISFTRVLVILPIIYFHIRNDYQINITVTLLIFYAIISDYLDGLVARRLNQVTELGKILDPVADKLIAFFLFGYIVLLGWIPVWFFVVGVVRDLLIMAGSLYIRKVRGKVAMAVMSGKISVNVLALYGFSVFFFPDADSLHNFFMIASLVMMILSFIHYCYRYIQILNGADFN